MKFSPNLGDGLIAASLESSLSQWQPGLQVVAIDLAARSRYTVPKQTRASVMRLLHGLHPRARLHLLKSVLPVFAKLRWRPHYASALKNVDAMVIGGGNLLTDIDLNFPVKLSSALDIAAERSIPVAIHGCGVGATWTVDGIRMMGAALRRADIRSIQVRDHASRRSFIRHFGQQVKVPVEVGPDLGLLLDRAYPDAIVAPENRRHIGVGVISPLALRYHSEIAVADDVLLEWYERLFTSLAGRREQAYLFHNGSPEDRSFAERLSRRLGGSELFTPRTPRELATFIGCRRAVIAFRMHALVSAHALGVPCCGLRWDRKLDDYFLHVGASDDLFDIRQASPDEVADRLASKAEQNSLPDLAALKEAAHQQVGAMLSRVHR